MTDEFLTIHQSTLVKEGNKKETQKLENNKKIN